MPGARALDAKHFIALNGIVFVKGADYGRRAMEKPDLAVSFFRGLTDKVKLVDPVKDRGNSNFKQLRFKAAIADYSTAIRLWYVASISVADPNTHKKFF